MAVEALVRNKLRSFLSVLGITIGIYCIISVYAMVHSLEKNLNDSFSGLGKDVVFVQKWPWDEFGGNYPWWRYLSRPQTSPDEAVFIEKNISPKVSMGVAYTYQDRGKVEYKNVALTDISLKAVSYGYSEVQKVTLDKGRYFTLEESDGGRGVVIIGAKIAEELFGTADPIGKQIRIKNRVCSVIGVFAKEGQSIINLSSDELVYMPVKFMAGFSNYREGEKGCQVLIRAREGVSLEDLGFEVAQLMRRYRRIRPLADANFAVNQMSMITSVISGVFGTIKMIGLIIGGFSMLVGCFGVANIMFVSVKERTQEIGIQKSLGAKRIFILLQFLFEAILLCVVGGVIGLLFVWLTALAANWVFVHSLQSAMRMFLSQEDVMLGMVVSVVVGIVAGFIPASGGARLNPVDAIRSK